MVFSAMMPKTWGNSSSYMAPNHREKGLPALGSAGSCGGSQRQAHGTRGFGQPQRGMDGGMLCPRDPPGAAVRSLFLPGLGWC